MGRGRGCAVAWFLNAPAPAWARKSKPAPKEVQQEPPPDPPPSFVPPPPGYEPPPPFTGGRRRRSAAAAVRGAAAGLHDAGPYRREHARRDPAGVGRDRRRQRRRRVPHASRTVRAVRLPGSGGRHLRAASRSSHGSPATPTTPPAMGNLEMGGFFLPTRKSETDRAARASRRRPRPTSVAERAPTRQPVRTADRLRPGRSPHHGPALVGVHDPAGGTRSSSEADGGFDLVLDQPSGPRTPPASSSARTSPSGLRLPGVDLALELVNLVLVNGDVAERHHRPRFIHTAAISVRTPGVDQFHFGMVFPLDKRCPWRGLDPVPGLSARRRLLAAREARAARSSR